MTRRTRSRAWARRGKVGRFERLLTALTPTVEVNDSGIRDDTPGRCHACRREVGQSHRIGCAAVVRQAIVRMDYEGETYRVPYLIPASWSRERVMDHLLNSSFCLGNLRLLVLDFGDAPPGPKLIDAPLCLCRLAKVELEKGWRGPVIPQGVQ